MRDDLIALQRFFSDAVRADAPLAAGLSDDLFAPGARGLSPAERLEIYREQYWLRHLANLRDDFPTVAWLTGEDEFRRVARLYLAAHPPRTWDLQRLGADFPAFAGGASAWRGDALVLDACRLDWAFMEAFDAPDTGPLDLRDAAGAPEDAWPAARIEFHPSLRRLSLAHEVHVLRDGLRADLASGRSPERPAARRAHVVVWRTPTNVLRAVSVDPNAFRLLEELAAGRPLGEACEAVVAGQSEGADISARVGAWFQAWARDGWVSALRLRR